MFFLFSGWADKQNLNIIKTKKKKKYYTKTIQENMIARNSLCAKHWTARFDDNNANEIVPAAAKHTNGMAARTLVLQTQSGGTQTQALR